MVLATCSFLFLVLSVASQPLKPQNAYEAADPMLYLTKYGYLQYSGAASRVGQLVDNSRVLSKAVQEFQAFAGLNTTGVLDTTTRAMMEKPRCGVKDRIGFGSRYKRYALQGSTWKKANLTYSITKYPRTRRLTKAMVDEEIRIAFNLWEKESGIQFINVESESEVDIEIRFEKYDHGDGDDFDGAGGTLAHAYFPEFGGDIHMDDSEFWTVDMDIGTNLRFTAAHEIGHTLGLSHSDISDALMSPFYKEFHESLELHDDDVSAISELYGAEIAKKRRETETLSSSLCSDPSFDSIVRTSDNSTYLFKGGEYWKLTDYGISPGYPRKISDDWPGLDNNIDAAFTDTDDGVTYVFKEDRVWSFRNQENLWGNPRSIAAEFPGIPNSLSAAFQWEGNGKTYFVKGSYYWRYDKAKEPRVKSYYPFSTSLWDFPPHITAALQWKNRRIYIFTRDKYYRLNHFKFEIAEDYPAYPRETKVWWFGCPEY